QAREYGLLQERTSAWRLSPRFRIEYKRRFGALSSKVFRSRGIGSVAVVLGKGWDGREKDFAGAH
ncbi:MAG TPA: hypothetical protein VLT92_17430, partial [Burkholderiales bacterium]|nr:hypothetical protein [Burkholderiales bacterium]